MGKEVLKSDIRLARPVRPQDRHGLAAASIRQIDAAHRLDPAVGLDQTRRHHGLPAAAVVSGSQEWLVLMLLNATGAGMSQQQLCQASGVDSGNMVAFIDQLDAAPLCEAQPRPGRPTPLHRHAHSSRTIRSRQGHRRR